MNTPRLSRGLSSLLHSVSPGRVSSAEAVTLPVGVIRPGRWQPRAAIDTDELNELALSIRASGVLQPILVRPLDGPPVGDVTHEIVAGERRWRASQIAGLLEIPVFIRALSAREALAAALIENIQRQDLNAMEEARALQRLIVEHNLTHEDLANGVGRSRVAVTNLLRLLELPPEIAAMLELRALSMGHARALLAVPHAAEQLQLARRVVQQGWTVRQIETAIRQSSEAPAPVTRGLVSCDVCRSKLGALRSVRGRGDSVRLVVDCANSDVRLAVTDAVRRILGCS